MELRIGENIKRLRKSNGMTQEQLAELVNVSCAAVSKWESADTYPDIGLIMPLAAVFGVTVDELMGYSAAKIGGEVEAILSDCDRMQREGRFAEAVERISRARKEYPSDYKIMSRYMWELAGGFADNDPAVLNARRGEFEKICGCILDGCGDEELRLDALTMKAKLCYAAGDTSSALAVLSALPSWYRTSGQKTEQLFPKDTPEFRHWVKQNLYELSSFAANKMVKAVWYGGEGDGRRASYCEMLGDLYAEMHERSGETAFVICEQAIFAGLADRLTNSKGCVSDIVRVRGKALAASVLLAERAKRDAELRAYLVKCFNTDNPCALTVNWLKNSRQSALAALREDRAYAELLAKYDE